MDTSLCKRPDVRSRFGSIGAEGDDTPSNKYSPEVVSLIEELRRKHGLGGLAKEQPKEAAQDSATTTAPDPENRITMRMDVPQRRPPLIEIPQDGGAAAHASDSPPQEVAPTRRVPSIDLSLCGHFSFPAETGSSTTAEGPTTEYPKMEQGPEDKDGEEVEDEEEEEKEEEEEDSELDPGTVSSNPGTSVIDTSWMEQEDEEGSDPEGIPVPECSPLPETPQSVRESTSSSLHHPSSSGECASSRTRSGLLSPTGRYSAGGFGSPPSGPLASSSVGKSLAHFLSTAMQPLLEMVCAVVSTGDLCTPSANRVSICGEGRCRTRIYRSFATTS